MEITLGNTTACNTCNDDKCHDCDLTSHDTMSVLSFNGRFHRIDSDIMRWCVPLHPEAFAPSYLYTSVQREVKQ